MGAIADSFVAFAQPLIDQTDGSMPGINRAMALAQMFWNLALLPADKREAAIDEMKPTLKMTDEEFAEFRQKVVLPMIDRHHEMFPGLHSRSRQMSDTFDVTPSPTKTQPGTGRNSPCPCGSGRKYKVCCGSRK
jgi:uncharacterized protein YecA (UPF0149 family)